jgi:hypothetical protein
MYLGLWSASFSVPAVIQCREIRAQSHFPIFAQAPMKKAAQTSRPKEKEE